MIGVPKWLLALVRFYCGSAGATSARMAIHFCAGILCVVAYGVTVWPGPNLYHSAVDWANGLTRSITELRAEIAEMKTATAIREASIHERVENRERRLTQAETDIDTLTKIANDHERRIYRIEGLR